MGNFDLDYNAYTPDDPPPKFPEAESSVVVEGDSKRYDLEKVDIPNEAQTRDAKRSSSSSSSSSEAAAGPSGQVAPTEPPPDFHEYEPSIDVKDDGDMVSHDPHLNEDGEALYRFILSHASKPPVLTLNVSGSHQERRTRVVTHYENGRRYDRTETYYETITDFAFTIGCTHHIMSEERAPIWIVGDSDPSYRGTMKRQVDNTPLPLSEQAKNKDPESGHLVVEKIPARRKATDFEKDSASARRERKERQGLAPWVLISGERRGMEATLESEEDRRNYTWTTHSKCNMQWDDSTINAPSKTLRAWADEYCQCRKMLKEFHFKKQIYGWNLDSLQQAVEEVVRVNRRHPGGAVSIGFSTDSDDIYVRADNGLARTLSKTWAYVLLWIFLIYPLIIWPFKRFSKWGGGEWRVAGSAFAMTKWVHLPDSIAGETVEQYRERNPDLGAPELKMTPRGISQLMGIREGEWFSQWQETIAYNVRSGRINYSYVETRPMPQGSTLGFGAGAHLDGYEGVLTRY